MRSFHAYTTPDLARSLLLRRSIRMLMGRFMDCFIVKPQATDSAPYWSGLVAREACSRSAEVLH